MNLKKLIILSALILIVLFIGGCKNQGVEQLLRQGKITAAEKRCENLKDQEKTDGYKSIAAFYLQEEKYQKAAQYYAKAGEHIKTINCYFLGDFISEAENYCAAQTDDIKRQCAENLGEKFFKKGDYTKAIHYYTMAAKPGKVAHIETKVPLFQLAEKTGKKSAETTDPDISATLNAIKKTLVDYVYIDRYLDWPYNRETEAEKTAAEVFDKALKVLENKAAPDFIKTLSSDTFDWSKKSIESVSFDHFKLQTIMNLILQLHRQAGQKNFLNKYLKGKQGKSQQETKDISTSSSYDEAVLRTLDHGKTLLQELEESSDPKNKEWQADYKSDITVDNQVIEYISSLLNNISLRLADLDKRRLNLKNSSREDSVKQSADKLFADFAGECNRVLHLVGKAEYQKANDLLVSSYNSAKAGFDETKKKAKESTPGK